MKRLIPALFFLIALACKPVITVVVTVTPTPTPQVKAEGTEPMPTVKPTSPPPVITGPTCTPDARLVADVTVPDNTAFAPGTPLIKTWCLHNSGTCPWAPGTKLVFVSGDSMGGPAMVDVPALVPGARTNVSANFTAPTTPGTYWANYQLQAPDGTRFGSIIWVQIVVPVTPTPTPILICTPPPCPGGIPVCPTPGACPGGCGLICVTPTPCPIPVDPALEPIVKIVRETLVNVGCPTGPAFSVYGAFQKFETNPEAHHTRTSIRAFMIWRSDKRKIYVVDPGFWGEERSESGYLIHRGMWFGTYDDTWDESQPEVHPACAGMSVPPGFQLPIRGFGKV
ncbi:MAG: NBR1-Ig-like domain-containing protein [Anaerolineae bacterium]|nr:NBR1-Ig-like domain-containing protein [Anaerolineae bacterium]